jgi:dephospho-CoA kinase
VDAPTLIEVGLHKLMDFNIVVWVDNASQVIRVKNRDLISEEQIMNRIEAQMPLDEKRKYADFVIDNSKDLEVTKEQFISILNKLIKFQGER